jgi:hypothetical protein
VLNLDDGVAGDGDKMPRELVQVTNWSSRSLLDKVAGFSGEEFWFTGAEGWDVMGWVVKPKGWTESDAKKGKVWPLGECFRLSPSIRTDMMQHSLYSQSRIWKTIETC